MVPGAHTAAPFDSGTPAYEQDHHIHHNLSSQFFNHASAVSSIKLRSCRRSTRRQRIKPVSSISLMLPFDLL
jgi:hypothetical protein